MTSLIKKIEVGANLAIIVVALLLVGVLIKPFLPFQTTSNPDGVALAVGAKVPLTNTDWAKNGRTMLLVLSSQCHFCTESAPFYQRLAKERATVNNVRLVAVLPQTVSDGQQYLSKLGITVDEIKQSSLDSIGVSGTPTLILADNTGTVSGAWVGKLQADKEAEVLDRLKQQ
jgi:thioredoxin-related protein